eukprot:scaffold2090_cov225-Prasinococcus_capsulatus_cf.AAC.44
MRHATGLTLVRHLHPAVGQDDGGGAAVAQRLETRVVAHRTVHQHHAVGGPRAITGTLAARTTDAASSATQPERGFAPGQGRTRTSIAQRTGRGGGGGHGELALAVGVDVAVLERRQRGHRREVGVADLPQPAPRPRVAPVTRIICTAAHQANRPRLSPQLPLGGGRRTGQHVLRGRDGVGGEDEAVARVEAGGVDEQHRHLGAPSLIHAVRDVGLPLVRWLDPQTLQADNHNSSSSSSSSSSPWRPLAKSLLRHPSLCVLLMPLRGRGAPARLRAGGLLRRLELGVEVALDDAQDLLDAPATAAVHAQVEVGKRVLVRAPVAVLAGHKLHEGPRHVRHHLDVVLPRYLLPFVAQDRAEVSLAARAGPGQGRACGELLLRECWRVAWGATYHVLLLLQQLPQAQEEVQPDDGAAAHGANKVDASQRVHLRQHAQRPCAARARHASLSRTPPSRTRAPATTLT